MNGRIKKNDYYTGCSYCKRLFCNENYDMGEYAYSLQYNEESYISAALTV